MACSVTFHPGHGHGPHGPGRAEPPRQPDHRTDDAENNPNAFIVEEAQRGVAERREERGERPDFPAAAVLPAAALTRAEVEEN